MHKQIIIFIVGLLSISLGGSLFILSNVGSDPFNVFMQGLSGLLGVTIGQSYILVSIVYASIIFILDKSYLKLGTVIAIVALGVMVDIGMQLLAPIFEQDLHFAIRLTAMLIGNAFIGIGVAIVYSAKLGMVPNDALPIIIANKTNKPFKWVRISYDSLTVIIGIILGGVFGVGTIICALITGPLIGYFMPKAKKVSDRLTHSN